MLLQLVVSGLALGSMYGLVALGYHITWATSRTMNFSQGHAVMAGAVVAYGAHVALGWPLPLALVATVAAAILFGLVVERVAVRPFFRSGSAVWLLSTIALGIIAENVAMLAFGRDARAFPSRLAQAPVFVGGAGVYPQELLLPVVGLALAALVQVFYHRTFFGKQLKASYDLVRISGRPHAFHGTIGSDTAPSRFAWFETVYLPFSENGVVSHILNAAMYQLRADGM